MRGRLNVFDEVPMVQVMRLPGQILLSAVLFLVISPAAAIAQEIETEPVPDDGTWWTVPALAMIAIAAVGVVIVVVKRRNRVPSLDERLPSAPVERPAKRPVEDSDAAPDVLRLLENPAVAPRPGGAADLSADPWS